VETERIIFGAQPNYFPSGMELKDVVEWLIITDPIRFAMAEVTLMGSSAEAIKAQLNAMQGVDGLLDWYDANDHHVVRLGSPSLVKGADPFDAVRAAPGSTLKLGDVEIKPPKGALSWKTEHESIWVDEHDTVYRQGSYYGGRGQSTLVMDPREAENAREQIEQQLLWKKQNEAYERRAKRNAERAKKPPTYKTLPKGKACTTYTFAVELLSKALAKKYESKRIVVKCIISTGYSKLRRGVMLQKALEAFELAKEEGFTLADWPDALAALGKYYAPLANQWDIAKNKADAEHCAPIMKLIWPDEDFPLPKSEGD